MTLKISRVSSFLFVFVLLLIMTGCNRIQKNIDIEMEIVSKNNNINFDEIANLEIFFDSIQQKHGIPIWHSEDSSKYIRSIYKSISEISKYRHGETKYYPQQLVNECLNRLVWNQSVAENHGAEINRDFFENYLNFVSFYCPDISYLVDMRTDDYMAGIKFFRTYSIAPFESYLIIKYRKRFKVIQIGSEQEILSIYKLKDSMGRNYYLCANNESIGMYFGQYLYMANTDNDVTLVTQNTIYPDQLRVEDKIYFNKDKLTWTICKENPNGKLIPLGNSFMKLILDGKNSKFIQLKTVEN